MAESLSQSGAPAQPCTVVSWDTLLCELIAVVQVEVLQPWSGAGCLGPALITEEAAVAQLQALQAGAAPGHCHQAFVCEFR